jgi:hypothetical protein
MLRLEQNKMLKIQEIDPEIKKDKITHQTLVEKQEIHRVTAELWNNCGKIFVLF